MTCDPRKTRGPSCWTFCKVHTRWPRRSDTGTARTWNFDRTAGVAVIEEATSRRRYGDLHASESNTQSDPVGQRVQGVPGDGRYLGASPAVPDVRSRRMLRRFEEPSRHQAFPRRPASDYSIVRAG